MISLVAAVFLSGKIEAVGIVVDVGNRNLLFIAGLPDSSVPDIDFCSIHSHMGRLSSMK